ncbi:concanavalin A-like lectin/glucanase [Caulochytrium protostelioides]|uniref:Concanavalin A-like lectin/glucanase n=1 Tax=Caulochytrium protostelioides TaxID=1555241 RepID=A0A4P9WQM5_9FUNG|nr:concanavalin A-like lectin/glucanase [Caulochytrium protostelioides]
MGRRRSLVATVATVFAGVAVAVAAVAGVGPSAVAADAVAGQDARPPPPSADPSADPLRLTPPVDAPLFEPFAQGLHASGWQVSKATKVAIDAADAELVIYQGRWELARPSVHAAAWAPDDRGLVMQTPNANHAIARPFATPMLHALPATGPPEHPLVVQYEVKLQDGVRCGGAYLKLLPYDATARFDATRFHDKTPFTIQFGPDACDDRDRDGVGTPRPCPVAGSSPSDLLHALC